MNYHDGVAEDGVLATCGVCGREVHMLDPEGQERICDPCGTEGWSGTLPACDIRRGHIVSIGQKTHLVIASDHVSGHYELELRDAEGNFLFRLFRNLQRIYVNVERDNETATEIVKARAQEWVMPEDYQVL